jgi:hypothetical protein
MTMANARPARDTDQDRNPSKGPEDTNVDVSESETAALRGSPLAPELAAMEDEEVAETVREAFREEVGEELEGEVANEALPAVARRIVEDELGFRVVDRMLVIDTAGGPQREVEDTGPTGQVPDETLELGDEEMEGEVSEDILETEEEGLVFVPPTRPVPER